MDLDWYLIKRILLTAWFLYLVVLVVWVVLQKRQPEATIGWIIALSLTPYVGFLVFYFFGPRRFEIQKKKRQRYGHATDEFKREIETLKQRSDHFAPHVRQISTLCFNACELRACTAQEIVLLPSTHQALDMIFQAISVARHHVHLEYYIFEPDQTGSELLKLLEKKAKQGVEVRLLVDALGSRRLSKKILEPLLLAGGQVQRFHDVHIARRWRSPVNHRTHRKIVICDGSVAFTGGVNITDEGNSRIYPDAYQDTHVMLRGNPAYWLQLVFFEDWSYASDTKLEQAIPNLDNYMCVHPVGAYDVQVLTSGPDNSAETIHRMYVQAIHMAQNKVFLATPYFVPTEAALFALSNAAMRGVDVRILVPKLSDSKLVTYAARSYFDELLAVGVRIWEFQGRMMHSKTIVVDNRFCFIGTANFDIRSFRLNYEVGVGVFDAGFVNQLANQFKNNLKQSKKVPTRRNAKFIARLAEAGARVLSPLL